jgi:hypothetical protein
MMEQQAFGKENAPRYLQKLVRIGLCEKKVCFEKCVPVIADV